MVNSGSDPATVGSVEALDSGDPARVLDSLTGAAVGEHRMPLDTDVIDFPARDRQE